jgi:hypothetical protein
LQLVIVILSLTDRCLSCFVDFSTSYYLCALNFTTVTTVSAHKVDKEDEELREGNHVSEPAVSVPQ